MPKPKTPPPAPDRIAPTEQREAHARADGGGIEIAQPERAGAGSRQILDARGEPGSPWRVVDTLAALERAGTITADERAAGERYRSAYELAGHAGLSAAPIMRGRSAGATVAGGISDARIDASRRVVADEALAGSAQGVALLRWVCGEGRSLAAWDRQHRTREGTGRGHLCRALAAMAAGRR